MQKTHIEVEADLPWMYNAKWKEDQNGRIAWVKTLKEGDAVCYTYMPAYGRKRRLVATKVLKITPTGKVRTADGELFDYTGFTKVRSDRAFAYLEPFSEKHRLYVEEMKKRMQAFNHIRVASWDALSTSALEGIKDILVKETLRREAEERERK